MNPDPWGGRNGDPGGLLTADGAPVVPGPCGNPPNLPHIDVDLVARRNGGTVVALCRTKGLAGAQSIAHVGLTARVAAPPIDCAGRHDWRTNHKHG